MRDIDYNYTTLSTSEIREIVVGTLSRQTPFGERYWEMEFNDWLDGLSEDAVVEEDVEDYDGF